MTARRLRIFERYNNEIDLKVNIRKVLSENIMINRIQLEKLVQQNKRKQTKLIKRWVIILTFAMEIIANEN